MHNLSTTIPHQASSDSRTVSPGLEGPLLKTLSLNHNTTLSYRQSRPLPSQWKVWDMRVVEGLERQKSTRDMFAGAGGEPASRPIPPVLESANSDRQTTSDSKISEPETRANSTTLS